MSADRDPKNGKKKEEKADPQHTTPEANHFLPKDLMGHLTEFSTLVDMSNLAKTSKKNKEDVNKTKTKMRKRLINYKREIFKNNNERIDFFNFIMKNATIEDLANTNFLNNPAFKSFSDDVYFTDRFVQPFKKIQFEPLKFFIKLVDKQTEPNVKFSLMDLAVENGNHKFISEAFAAVERAANYEGRTDDSIYRERIFKWLTHPEILESWLRIGINNFDLDMVIVLSAHYARITEQQSDFKYFVILDNWYRSKHPKDMDAHLAIKCKIVDCLIKYNPYFINHIMFKAIVNGDAQLCKHIATHHSLENSDYLVKENMIISTIKVISNLKNHKLSISEYESIKKNMLETLQLLLNFVQGLPLNEKLLLAAVKSKEPAIVDAMLKTGASIVSKTPFAPFDAVLRLTKSNETNTKEAKEIVSLFKKDISENYLIPFHHFLNTFLVYLNDETKFPSKNRLRTSEAPHYKDKEKLIATITKILTSPKDPVLYKAQLLECLKQIVTFKEKLIADKSKRYLPSLLGFVGEYGIHLSKLVAMEWDLHLALEKITKPIVNVDTSPQIVTQRTFARSAAAASDHDTPSINQYLDAMREVCDKLKQLNASSAAYFKPANQTIGERLGSIIEKLAKEEKVESRQEVTFNVVKQEFLNTLNQYKSTATDAAIKQLREIFKLPALSKEIDLTEKDVDIFCSQGYKMGARRLD